ncbi:MAG: hypothetical protein FWD69_08225 [Polyangiaceae bacterium]|nr:hypothetical protein [Polyangiaceae bacterium]
MIQVTVKWLNERSPLLPDAGAAIELAVDGKALSPISAPLGKRVFEVPNGTTKLTLKASFVASFPATTKFPATSAEVLRIEQSYTVKDGTRIDPDPMAAFGGGPHPLAVIKGLAGMSNAGPIGAAVITLRTEFVDIEPFWQVYAKYWTEYHQGHQPGSRLVPLGYTGGFPIVWFASVPDKCIASSEAAVSCLTFFRPSSQFGYTKVDQAHEMWELMRYLLAPKDDFDPYARAYERDHIEDRNEIWLFCGFENALVKSGRAVLMIHPWPSGGAFGKAVTKDLPTLCEQILRNLWARQLICRNVANARLGRFGLSAFSYGGEALWKALAANKHQVEELYLFDCNKTGTKINEIVQWYKSIAKTPKLRMVGGAFNVITHNKIVKAIGLNQNVTAVLNDPNWFVAKGAHPYWDHVVSKFSNLRNDQGVHHQFAIFGGEYIGGPGSEVETFLCQFLKSSAF